MKIKIDSLIEQLKKCGYSIFIRSNGSKNVIIWTTTTHWASASFAENSQDDLKRVCKRLEETIYNINN